jgi:hypothetical protein
VTATSVTDLATSITATVNLTPVTIQVSPPYLQLQAAQTQQFTAFVTDANNPAVVWNIAPNVGTISASGLYTAPSVITNPQLITIMATSVADPLRVATAILSLTQSGATTSGLRFKPITPCRLMETRPEYNVEGRTGPFGPPFLNADETRTLVVTQSGTCKIPASARALFVNVTIVPIGPADYVTLWQSGVSRPPTWTVRSPAGVVLANSAIVQLGTDRGLNIYARNATNLLIDVSGYFTADPAESSLVYYPISPCRVIETRPDYRPQPGPFGPPSLAPRSTRRFRISESPDCPIPANAAAYSVTMTVVPSEPLSFLSAWPSGSSPPNVSTINSPDKRIIANSVIIPAGEEGAIDVLAYNRTDLVVDINGFFAPDTGSGLFYYPVPQCRLVDTANPGLGNIFGPPAIPANTVRTVPIRSSSCALGSTTVVGAYALNMTALPNGQSLPFITAYPTGHPRPNASQLNAFEGQVISDAAIVPAGTNGSIDIFTYQATNLVLEISGFFGR